MKNDVVEILERAVAIARAGGHEVDGWTLQSGEEGYVAWLYREDDESQVFLFDDVEVMSTAVAAARTCLERAEAMVAAVGAAES